MKARELFAKLEKDPKFIKAYEELAPELDIARQTIRLRVELGMTQSELAEKIGTRQSNISRLENAVGHPSLSLLKRVGKALGAKLCVRFESPSEALGHAEAEMSHSVSLLHFQKVIVPSARPLPNLWGYKPGKRLPWGEERDTAWVPGRTTQQMEVQPEIKAV